MDLKIAVCNDMKFYVQNTKIQTGEKNGEVLPFKQNRIPFMQSLLY